jgi:beta-lactamase class A
MVRLYTSVPAVDTSMKNLRMHRRHFLLTGIPLLVPLVSRGQSSVPQPDNVGELEAIERRLSGRLGVSVIDTATGRRLAWRDAERFPMCSTFKWLLAAHVLSRVDAGAEQLARRIEYGERDLLDYAPITKSRVAEGSMSVADLSEAIVRHSDNTAANQLLFTAGGPTGLTAYLRTIGDPSSRLDRLEPDLNSAEPGDPRDTTTPSAMLSNLQAVLLGDRLSGSSRDRLTAWLVGNTTGDTKLRAGLPKAWRVGDKTGMGANGATNDVAIVWPSGRVQPTLVAAYLTETVAPVADRNAALADVARVVRGWLGA